MNILIATEPEDYHAILVKLALERTGHVVDLFFTADHPTQQKNTIYIDNYRSQWSSQDEQGELCGDNYEVVWWRRARKPYLDKSVLHPRDYPIVSRENTAFYDSLSKTMASQAWWVNSIEATDKARSKLFQLRTAVDCGLNIPSTLCTNDPQKIRDFLFQKEDVIYKPMTLHLWHEQEQIKIAYTSKLTQADLSDDTLLRLVPGIYQQEIKKSYELRITCFGDYLVAAKLNSQSHDLGKIDWRKIPDYALEVEPYELPLALQEQIRAFMHQMGLAFGALDFIVTPEGEYFFLEVNEQGQFLWIEDSNPDFKMLDIFVNFLINKSTDFQWDAQKARHDILDYVQEAEEIAARQMQEHVHVNQITFIHSEGV